MYSDSRMNKKNIVIGKKKSDGHIFEAVKNYKGDTGITLRELQEKFNHISANDLQ